MFQKPSGEKVEVHSDRTRIATAAEIEERKLGRSKKKWKRYAREVLSRDGWPEPHVRAALNTRELQPGRLHEKTNPHDESIASHEAVLTADPVSFWKTVAECYCGFDRFRWKRVAMLYLYVGRGWYLKEIGRAFDNHKTQVSRMINQARGDLARTFKVEFSADFEIEDETRGDRDSCAEDQANADRRYRGLTAGVLASKSDRGFSNPDRDV